MATTIEFGNWGSFGKDIGKDIVIVDVQEIPEETDRRLSVSEQTNVVYRRLSIGAESRVPTYHEYKEANYILPNDSPEHARLEAQAVHLSEMMHNDILHAPVDPTAARVLDIGCGTGIVTDVMSKKYTGECIGLDLSRVPKIRPHKSNVHFFQGNAAAQKPTEWVPNDDRTRPFEQDANLFDHIFSRLLILGMTNWSEFIETEYELLKPGGWAEVQDLAWDWYNPDGQIVSVDWEWLKVLRRDFESKKNLDLHCGKNAEQRMRDAGFEDVQVFKHVFSTCGQTETTEEARQFGQFNADAVPVMLHHAIEKALTGGEEPSPEVQTTIDELRAEMKECLRGGQGLYQIFYVTIGRKPRV